MGSQPPFWKLGEQSSTVPEPEPELEPVPEPARADQQPRPDKPDQQPRPAARTSSQTSS